MATTYTVTHDFTTGTVAQADQVDTNFTDILTAINALDASNLASGTVALARISGLTSTQCAAAFFKDEDAMTSNSATAVASQQSVKAYADTKEAALVTQATASIFGSWTANDSDTNALVKDEIYQVTSDGFLSALAGGNNQRALIYTDGSNPPTTLRAAGASYGGYHGGTSCIIRKNDYFEVNNATGSIYWLPIGTGECQIQA